MFKKILSSGVIFFFTVTNVFGAAPYPAEMPLRFQKLVDRNSIIRISDEAGSVNYRAEGELPLIIHIQDAHANYEAQLHIKNILNELVEKYQVRLIGLEGASGSLRPELFRFFPVEKANAAVIDSLVRDGELTGAESFAVENGRADIDWIGLEDKDGYRKDLAIYRATLEKWNSHRAFFEKAGKDLIALKTKKFSSDLRKFDAKQNSFGDGKDTLFHYGRYLRKAAERFLKLDLTDPKEQGEFPNLVRLSVLARLEPELKKNTDRALREKEALIRAIQDGVSGKDPEREFVLATLKDLKGLGWDRPLPARYFFEALYGICAERNISPETYPAFGNFAKYLILQDEIDAKDFFDEITALEAGIYEFLIRTEEERTIVGISRDLKLLEKFLRLEVSREEYLSFKSREKELTASCLAAKIASLNTLSDSEEKESLGGTDRAIQDAQAFYDLAMEREHAFIERLLGKAREKKLKNAVLISGGFHTQGIQKILEDQNIAHVVIEPKLSKEDKTGNYHKTILNGKTRLEEFLGETAPKSGESAAAGKIVAALKAVDQKVYAELNPGDPIRQEKVALGALIYAVAPLAEHLLNTNPSLQTDPNAFVDALNRYFDELKQNPLVRDDGVRIIPAYGDTGNRAVALIPSDVLRVRGNYPLVLIQPLDRKLSPAGDVQAVSTNDELRRLNLGSLPPAVLQPAGIQNLPQAASLGDYSPLSREEGLQVFFSRYPAQTYPRLAVHQALPKKDSEIASVLARNRVIPRIQNGWVAVYKNEEGKLLLVGPISEEDRDRFRLIEGKELEGLTKLLAGSRGEELFVDQFLPGDGPSAQSVFRRLMGAPAIVEGIRTGTVQIFSTTRASARSLEDIRRDIRLVDPFIPSKGASLGGAPVLGPVRPNLRDVYLAQVDEKTPAHIKAGNPVFDITDDGRIVARLKKEHLYDYDPVTNPEGLGLWKWLEDYEAEAKVATAGIRLTQNVLYPWDTRNRINEIGIAFATWAKGVVVNEKFPGAALRKMAGGEVRYNTGRFVDMIARINAALGIRTYVPYGIEEMEDAHGKVMRRVPLPIWMVSYLAFMYDLVGAEHATSSHAGSSFAATKDINNQGSQYLPEESVQFVSKIHEAFQRADDEGEFTFEIGAADDALIDDEFMKSIENGIIPYVEYLRKGVATEVNLGRIRDARSKILIDSVGGSMHRTMTKIFERLGIGDSFEWLHVEEDPYFHGIGKELTEDGKYNDYTQDTTIIKRDKKTGEVKSIPVMERMGYDKLLADKPVGTTILMTDPDGDRLVTAQVESADRIEFLRSVGVDYLVLDEKRIVALYTPNQSFFMTMVYQAEALKAAKSDKKRALTEEEKALGYTEPRKWWDHPRFIITTTASSAAWVEWAEKNGVKVLSVPVGFKEIAAMMKKVEAQMADHPGEPVIVRDVFGKEVNLGVDPRMLFAGEESGGMIIGPEELIESVGGRKAIAMREKSAGEALVIQAAMAAHLESQGKMLSDYLQELFDANDIKARFDVREDTVYYNQNNPDPDALKADKKEGEGRRTKNYVFFLSMALAHRDGKLTKEQVIEILNDAFRDEGLDFSDLEGIYFVGDGVFFKFPNKVLEIRPSGTDAKSKSYAMGDNKKELARFAAVLGGYSGEITALHGRFVPEEYVTNGMEKGWDAYQEYYRDGLPEDTYQPPAQAASLGAEGQVSLETAVAAEMVNIVRQYAIGGGVPKNVLKGNSGLNLLVGALLTSSLAKPGFEQLTRDVTDAVMARTDLREKPTAGQIKLLVDQLERNRQRAYALASGAALGEEILTWVETIRATMKGPDFNSDTASQTTDGVLYSVEAFARQGTREDFAAAARALENLRPFLEMSRDAAAVSGGFALIRPDVEKLIALVAAASSLGAEAVKGAMIAEALSTPLDAHGNAETAKRYEKGGYEQDGYGVAEGAAVAGSFAFEGNQGYFTVDAGGKETGRQAFLDTVTGMKQFFARRAERLGKPIRYVIKPGIGGQHTPFQGIADVFQVIDPTTGLIIGEYELGKNYEESIAAALKAIGADWDQIAVIPSSKSGSTDETMMIFTDIFYAILKNISEKQGIAGKQFADTVLATLHEVNFVNGKERPGKDLFKVDEERFGTTSLLALISQKAQARGLSVTPEQVRKIFGIVLGNMFFETTDRPEQSRLSAFIRNSGLDGELGGDAPGFGAMFDNVGGRWTGDLHMMTFLAFHDLDAERYWRVRHENVEQVREGIHAGVRLGNAVLDREVTDIALVVPDEYFWFGKSIEQNFNESIWQEGFANLVAIRQSDWDAQEKHYRGAKNKLVINLSSRMISEADYPTYYFRLPDLQTRDKQALAEAFAELNTIFYGMTATVGNRLIARAIEKAGLRVEDVDVGNLDKDATKILQQNLYVRQPYVELGKGLLEKRLKALQEAAQTDPEAVQNALGEVLSLAQGHHILSNVPEIATLSMPKINAQNASAVLTLLIRTAMDTARASGRKLVPFIYLEGGKFIDLRDALIAMGIEWVMQGTGDQHISYQQVLAQPQKYMPFIISFVSEDPIPGKPAIGFAKGYLDRVSPNLVRDYFAEASYQALTDLRAEQGGQGVFMRLVDNAGNRAMLRDAFRKAAASSLGNVNLKTAAAQEIAKAVKERAASEGLEERMFGRREIGLNFLTGALLTTTIEEMGAEAFQVKVSGAVAERKDLTESVTGEQITGAVKALMSDRRQLREILQAAKTESASSLGARLSWEEAKARLPERVRMTVEAMAQILTSEEATLGEEIAEQRVIISVLERFKTEKGFDGKVVERYLPKLKESFLALNAIFNVFGNPGNEQRNQLINDVIEAFRALYRDILMSMQIAFVRSSEEQRTGKPYQGAEDTPASWDNAVRLVDAGSLGSAATSGLILPANVRKEFPDAKRLIMNPTHEKVYRFNGKGYRATGLLVPKGKGLEYINEEKLLALVLDPRPGFIKIIVEDDNAMTYAAMYVILRLMEMAQREFTFGLATGGTTESLRKVLGLMNLAKEVFNQHPEWGKARGVHTLDDYVWRDPEVLKKLGLDDFWWPAPHPWDREKFDEEAYRLKYELGAYRNEQKYMLLRNALPHWTEEELDRRFVSPPVLFGSYGEAEDRFIRNMSRFALEPETSLVNLRGLGTGRHDGFTESQLRMIALMGEIITDLRKMLDLPDTLTRFDYPASILQADGLQRHSETTQVQNFGHFGGDMKFHKGFLRLMGKLGINFVSDLLNFSMTHRFEDIQNYLERDYRFESEEEFIREFQKLLNYFSAERDPSGIGTPPWSMTQKTGNVIERSMNPDTVNIVMVGDQTHKLESAADSFPGRPNPPFTPSALYLAPRTVLIATELGAKKMEKTGAWFFTSDNPNAALLTGERIEEAWRQTPEGQRIEGSGGVKEAWVRKLAQAASLGGEKGHLQLAGPEAGAEGFLPKPAEELEDLEGLFTQVQEQLAGFVGTERAEAFLRAVEAQNGDAKRIFATRLIRFTNDLDVMGRSKRQDNVIEINWRIFDYPDVEAIELFLANQLLPHHIDRYRLKYTLNQSAQRDITDPAKRQAKESGTVEYVAILRDLVRFRALRTDEQAKITEFLRAKEALIDGRHVYADILIAAAEKGSVYDERKTLAYHYVTDAHVYGAASLPLGMDHKVDADMFAQEVGQYLGGTLFEETRDLAQYFLSQLNAPNLSKDRITEILREAVKVERDGIRIMEPERLPNSADEWVEHLLKEDWGVLFRIIPRQFEELMNLMGQALPLANRFMAGGSSDVFYAYLPILTGEFKILLDRVQQMHQITDPEIVRDMIVFMKKTQEFIEANNINEATVEEFVGKIPAVIREERGLVEETPTEIDERFRKLLGELSGKDTWDRSQLKKMLYEFVQLGRRGDVAQAIDEEVIPLRLQDWVRYIVEKGHIRRLVGYNRKQIDQLVDLTQLTLPMYALANYLMLYWDYWCTEVYFMVQTEYYANPDADCSKADPLTALMQAVFQYDLDDLQKVADWALDFSMGPYGDAFLSARLDRAARALSVLEEGERKDLEGLSETDSGAVARATDMVWRNNEELSGDEDFRGQYPVLAGKLDDFLAAKPKPEIFLGEASSLGTEADQGDELEAALNELGTMLTQLQFPGVGGENQIVGDHIELTAWRVGRQALRVSARVFDPSISLRGVSVALVNGKTGERADVQNMGQFEAATTFAVYFPRAARPVRRQLRLELTSRIGAYRLTVEPAGAEAGADFFVPEILVGQSLGGEAYRFSLRDGKSDLGEDFAGNNWSEKLLSLEGNELKAFSDLLRNAGLESIGWSNAKGSFALPRLIILTEEESVPVCVGIAFFRGDSEYYIVDFSGNGREFYMPYIDRLQVMGRAVHNIPGFKLGTLKSIVTMRSKGGAAFVEVAPAAVAASLGQGSYPKVPSEDLGVEVLLGAVSNTLKDMMRGFGDLSAGKQYVFVLPPQLFVNNRAYGEMEFLIYFNAFVKGSLFNPNVPKPQVVGTKEQLEALREYLSHTLFGPDLSDPAVYPWLSEKDRNFLKAMHNHYAIRSKDGKIIPVEGYLEMIPFEERNDQARVVIPAENQMTAGVINIRRVRAEDGEIAGYKVTQTKDGADKDLGQLPVRYDLPEPKHYPVPAQAAAQIQQMRDGFARTWIGTSTGFDPQGDTTSMILWLEGLGIWVDPSHEGLHYMKELGLGEADVPYVLLTHAHQDHDGGVLKRILMGKRVRLIASRVVYEEFMRKAELLLKFIDKKLDPHALVDWVPLDPGKPLKLKLPSGKEATLRSWWNLHSIPTNGFSIEYDGFRYAHSSDTQWDPAFIDKLVREKKITPNEGRAQKYRFVKKDGTSKFDFIDHEAGGAPIHTTLEMLAQLPDDVRQRMNVYHVPDSKVEEKFGLAKGRMFETTPFISSDTERQQLHEIGVLTSNALMKDKSGDFYDVFQRLARRETVQKGQTLTIQGHRIHVMAFNGFRGLSAEGPEIEGDRGRAYFIVSGVAGVYVDGKKVAELGPSTHFGDWSIVTGEPRTATVVAEEPLEVYSLTPAAYLALFGSPATIERVQWLRENLETLEAWSQNTTKTSQFFQDLSDFALIVLAGEAAERKYKAGETVIREGTTGREFFIVKRGRADVVKGEEEAQHFIASIQPGESFGEIALLRDVERTANVVAGTDLDVLVFTREQLMTLLDHYPLIRMEMERQVDDRILELIRDYVDRPSFKRLVPSVAEFRLLLAHLARKYSGDRMHALLSMMDKTILDLGAGRDAHLVRTLRGLGFSYVRGVDVAVNTVMPYLLQGDMRNLDMIESGTVDVVFITNFLQDDLFYEKYPKDFYERIAREIFRILRPDGRFYLVTGDNADPALEHFRQAGFQVNTLVRGMYELIKPGETVGASLGVTGPSELGKTFSAYEAALKERDALKGTKGVSQDALRQADAKVQTTREAFSGEMQKRGWGALSLPDEEVLRTMRAMEALDKRHDISGQSLGFEAAAQLMGILSAQGRRLFEADGVNRTLTGWIHETGEAGGFFHALYFGAEEVPDAGISDELSGALQMQAESLNPGLGRTAYYREESSEGEFAVLAATAEDISVSALKVQLGVNKLAYAEVVYVGDTGYEKFESDLKRELGDLFGRVELTKVASRDEAVKFLNGLAANPRLRSLGGAGKTVLSQTELAPHITYLASPDIVNGLIASQSVKLATPAEEDLEGISREDFRLYGNTVGFALARLAGDAEKLSKVPGMDQALRKTGRVDLFRFNTDSLAERISQLTGEFQGFLAILRAA